MCVIAVSIYFSSRPPKPVTKDEEPPEHSARASDTEGHFVAGKNEEFSPEVTISNSAAAITPSSASERLKEYASIADINSRAKSMAQVIKELCRGGHANEAWSLISDQAGQVRDFQLYAFFGEANLSQEDMIKHISDLGATGYKADQSTALMAYMERFDCAGIGSLAKSSDFKALSDAMMVDSPIIFKNTIESYFLVALSQMEANSQPEILQTAQHFYEQGLIEDDDLYNIMKRGTAVDPFDRWKILNQGNLGSDGAENRDRQALVSQMVQSDAERTVSLIVSSTGENAIVDLSTAVRQWVTQEPVEATKWFQDSQSELTENKRDAVVVAFAKSAIVYSERDNAIQWAGRIADPKRKADVLRQIDIKFNKPK